MCSPTEPIEVRWRPVVPHGEATIGVVKVVECDPICLRLLLQDDRRAASRACCTAGRSNAIRIAMMAMTTKSSMSVKPRRERGMEISR